MCTVTESAIADYKLIQDEKSGYDWMTTQYDKNNVIADKKGGDGFDGLAAALSDEKVQYGYIRLVYEETSRSDEGGKPRTKFVLISWVGPSVKGIMEKSKPSTHSAEILKNFNNHSVHLQISDRSDLNREDIVKRLQSASF